jgi:hypothetical protein
MVTSLDISVKLLESDSRIENKVLNAIAEEVNDKIIHIIDKIRDEIRLATVLYLQSTGTYESLVNGDLAGHFGLVQGRREYHVNVILQTIANNIEVEYRKLKRVAKHFTGGLQIRVLIKDFSDILGLPQAVQFTERLEPLEWLDWLLTKGDRPIIKEWEIRFYPGKGRSGMAIMVEDDAESWRVPPEFSGTIRSNWLTKDINNPIYLSIIKTVIQKEMDRIQ